MTPVHSHSPTQPKTLLWTIGASMLLLLIAAAVGGLGAMLIFISLLVMALGVFAIFRDGLPSFKISNRRSGTGVVIIGVYLCILGALGAANSEGPTPATAKVGESCEVEGAISEIVSETLYCTPSASDDLVWASAADFKTHQTAADEKLVAEAEENAQTSVDQHEEELAAAEKRADDAETNLKEYQEEVKVAEAKAAEAEEAAEEREQEAAQNAPAPAPTQQSNTSNSSPFENCTAAREAGAAPVYRGDPGYGTHLDRDGDGIGCE